MNLAAFVFSTVVVLMHTYMERDRQSDLSKTLDEIEEDINFPRPEEFDFIIGKSTDTQPRIPTTTLEDLRENSLYLFIV